MITDRAADRDREADSGGSANRVSERYIAPDQEGNDDSAAAYGDQRAQPAGKYASQCNPDRAGQLARSFRTYVKQHLCSREINKQCEEYSKKMRRDAGGK